ncbi:MAG: hypothetical protein RLZZ15_1391, partial [Verrucomicrobiota bacterium]
MPYDESLAARVARHLDARRAPYEAKRMMGGLCYMVRGKMCVGVETHRLMARIDPAEQEAALRRPGCRPMDFTGRPMRGFVFVDIAHLRTDGELAAWLDLALAFNPQAKSSKKSAQEKTRGPSAARIAPLLPFRENLRRKKLPAAAELAALLNLGPKSAAWLAAAGIRSRDEVQHLGPIEVCRRVRAGG